MTTIAYKDGVLASDTLGTSGGLRDCNRIQKVHKVGPLLVAGAGASALCARFTEWVRAGMKGDSPWTGNEGGNSLIIMPDDTILVFGMNGPWRVKQPVYAMGSGESLALGAMAAGASAEQAVEIAMRYDIYSGGEIRTVRR